MDTTDFLALVEGGLGTFTVEFHSDPKPAAAHRARRLRKVSTALCMTGAKFSELRVNKDRVTGPLPWGEWKVAPYVIEHKGTEYARLYVVENGIKLHLHRGRRGRPARRVPVLPDALAARREAPARRHHHGQDGRAALGR